MNAPFFIAQRLHYKREGGDNSTRPAIRIATAGIIIGVMIMILTLCIVIGFKQTVAQKTALFGGHIQITHFSDNSTFELHPITVSDSLLNILQALPHIVSAQPFLTKPGILKTDTDFQGIVLRAVEKDTTFAQNLIEGTMPRKNNEITLSSSLCQRLRLHCGEDVYCYFVGDELRVRKLTVSGVYATGFSEADNLFVWCLPPVIRQLNRWDTTQASGIELHIDRLQNLQPAAEEVWFATANRLDEDANALYTQTLEQLNPQIFSWLDLLDMNVVIIILLMLSVSVFNIISGLIILILDSVTLVGTLKALGANNRFIKRIFLYEAAMLIGKGMLWGNIVGIGLAAVQYMTHLIPLDPTSYYVNFVPIAFPWLWIIVLNIGVLAVSMLVLLAPATIATRISPARVIRYD